MMAEEPKDKNPIKIKPVDPSVFKKSPGERGYNSVSKLQSSAQDLMGAKVVPAENALAGDGAKYTEQTLITIKGCLDTVDLKLKNSSVIGYLISAFGEEQAENILKQKSEIQLQLRDQYNSIIKPPGGKL